MADGGTCCRNLDISPRTFENEKVVRPTDETKTLGSSKLVSAASGGSKKEIVIKLKGLSGLPLVFSADGKLTAYETAKRFADYANTTIKSIFGIKLVDIPPLPIEADDRDAAKKKMEGWPTHGGTFCVDELEDGLYVVSFVASADETQRSRVFVEVYPSGHKDKPDVPRSRTPKK